MDHSTFNEFRTLIEREAGIHLADEKRQLLANRIQKRMRTLTLTDPKKYLQIVETDLSGEELLKLIDAISTNTTYFYREERHFAIFAQYLREVSQKIRPQIKVWCAASSSGEEPYTLAMTVLETLGRNHSVKILATDISTKVLKHAVGRTYEETQLEKLPSSYKSKYFQKKIIDGRTLWEVTPEVASLVTFKRLNLVEHPLPLKGDLDFIFCRNVMIYFQRTLRGQLIHEFTRLMRVGGYLFLSHSENLLGITHSLKSVNTAVYQKPGAVNG